MVQLYFGWSGGAGAKSEETFGWSGDWSRGGARALPGGGTRETAGIKRLP